MMAEVYHKCLTSKIAPDTVTCPAVRRLCRRRERGLFRLAPATSPPRELDRESGGHRDRAADHARAGPQVRLRLARRAAACASSPARASRSRPTTPAPATSRRPRTRPSRRSGPGFDRIPPLANPIGGPGLARRRRARRHARRHASRTSSSTTTPGSPSGPGAARSANRRAGPSSPSDYTTKIFRHTPGPSGTTRDGTLHFSDRITWPITPFIGTLGVAPDREVTTSLDGQGEWGGNLDIRDVAPGNRILPAGLPRGRAASTSATSTPARATPSSPAPPPRRRRPCACSFDLVKGEARPVDADREAGVDRLRVRLPAARGRRRDGHGQPDGLAHHATTASPRPTRTAWSAPARTSASTSTRCARSAS